MSSRYNLAEAHSSEPNLIGSSSEPQIDHLTCGWLRGQTAYHAASDRLGTICYFELDQESGITFPVVQWNDSAVERVAPESLSCPLIEEYRTAQSQQPPESTPIYLVFSRLISNKQL